MKNILKRSSVVVQVALAMVLIVIGGCSTNVWDELPGGISEFVTEYWPGQGVSGYSETADGNRVEMANGATLTFDGNNNWTIIDGNGNTLPQVLVYDQVPPAVFNYLEEIEQSGKVYKISRTSSVYIITLADTYITYDIDSGAITYPSSRKMKLG